MIKKIAKRVAVFMLATALSITNITFTASAATEESKLGNLYTLLNDTSTKDIKIAFLGGSITNGSEASNAESTSWRALVGQWFKDNYPDKTFTTANAGIGSTGSWFGQYRLYDDLDFKTKAPDVLFVEFAVNDYLEQSRTGENGTALGYESIIRQAFAANPKMTIITVFTTHASVAANTINEKSDTDFEAFKIQRAIASKYGLAQINVGEQFVNEYIKPSFNGQSNVNVAAVQNSAAWKEYVADQVHPNDKGYKIYADYITNYISEQLGSNFIQTEKAVNIGTITPYVESIKAGLSSALVTNGRRFDFSEFTADTDLKGWTRHNGTTEVAPNTMQSRCKAYIKTDKRNSSFAFSFKGSKLNFVWTGSTQGGELSYTIKKKSNGEIVKDGYFSVYDSVAMPYPGLAAGELPEDEYIVEAASKTGPNGDDALIQYIYIDGESPSVTPTEAPTITANGKLYNANGAEISTNDGNAYTYVAKSGSVTKDGKTYASYRTLADALDGLGTKGGIIVLANDDAWRDVSAAREKITITSADPENKVTLSNTTLNLTNGDLELRNIKIVGDSNERWSGTNGHKLILGSGFESGAGIKPAAHTGAMAAPTNVDIHDGVIGTFGAVAGWGSSLTVTGDSTYNIYGGTLSNHVAGFSRNGNDNGGAQILNGDAIFNIYGGNVNTSLFTSVAGGTLNGKLIYNISGGTFKSGEAIVFGQSQRTIPTINGSQVIIINNKEIQAADGSLSGVSIGDSTKQNPSRNLPALAGDHTAAIIVNNSELSGDTGVTVAAATEEVDYVISVSQGKAVPQYDAANKISDFKLIADTQESDPYLDGKPIQLEADGTYNIPTGRHSVVFASDADKTVVDFAASSKDITGALPETTSCIAVATMPSANGFSREGYTFVGWVLDGDNSYTVYQPGETVGVSGSAATFRPLWKATSHVCLSSSSVADSDGDGFVDVKDAYTTLQSAITALGTNGGKIYVCGEYDAGWFTESNTARGIIDICAVNPDSGKFIISGDTAFKNNNVTFDNITIKSPNNQRWISIDGHKLTFGENVIVEANGNNKLFVGVPGAISSGSEYEINNGLFTSIMAGGKYGSSATSTGNVRYTINGGTFNEVFGGSRNDDSATTHTINGNINYTINGGNFTNHIYLGSIRNGVINGNVLFTINGGTVNNNLNIIAGNKTTGTNGSCEGDNVVIVNGGNFNNNTLGKSGTGVNLTGDEIYIINNVEKNTEIKINTSSTAAYKIRVTGGKAVPVYAEATVGGKRLGFDITPDLDGYLPVVDGKPLAKNTNGYYDLEADETAGSYIDISFVPVYVENKNLGAGSYTADIYLKSSLAGQSAVAILAFYDSCNTLIQINKTDITIAEGKTYVNIPLEKIPAYNSYKFMLWDSLNTLKPLADLNELN